MKAMQQVGACLRLLTRQKGRCHAARTQTSDLLNISPPQKRVCVCTTIVRRSATELPRVLIHDGRMWDVTLIRRHCQRGPCILAPNNQAQGATIIFHLSRLRIGIGKVSLFTDTPDTPCHWYCPSSYTRRSTPYLSCSTMPVSESALAR